MKVLFMAMGLLLTLPDLLRAADSPNQANSKPNPPANAQPAAVGAPDGSPAQETGMVTLGCEHSCDLYLDGQTICINKQEYKCKIKNWDKTGKEC